MHNIYRSLLQHLKNGEHAVMITQYRAEGITKTLYRGDPPVGSAPTDHAPLRENPHDALCLERHGDAMTLTEFFSPKPRLLILGAGHIALPLAAMGALLRFDVVVFDDRLSFADKSRFPDAKEVICDYFDVMPQRLAVRANDYVAVVTRGHKHDQNCLRAILRGVMPFYIGMIGSKRRVGIVKRQLLAEGYPQEALDRLHSPIGLDIGAVTPEEISIAILAEMIQEKRRGDGTCGLSADISRGEGTFADTELVEWLAGEHPEKAVVVTVLSVQGSAPRGAGAKMAVSDNGRIVGSIGGGCAEAEVIQEARRIIREGGWCCKTVDMTDSAEEDGMVCGGIMTVLIEAHCPA
jgi:xanthine dehydrogenase accessory factor